MESITYSLKAQNENSNQYYEDISVFTDEVLRKIKGTAQELVKEYQLYVGRTAVEYARSAEEYELEILVIGVLWNCYSRSAMNLSEIPRSILCMLVESREKRKYLKKNIDIVRGLVSARYLLLSPKGEKSEPFFNIDNFNRLINWLRASGDFKQEVKRINLWKGFLEEKDCEYIVRFLECATNLAKWFKIRAKAQLGRYTARVERFLAEHSTGYRFREDRIFCGRQEIQYHLNMVGAEIMNRAFRDAFLKTKEKMLLLPACMRLNSEKNCKAVKTEEGYICENCSQGCRINQLDSLGNKYNFKVRIIPHESDAFSKRNVRWGQIGIVGVACVLNLISGGWKAREYNFVPQCVILEYCGCRNHWHKYGILTDITDKQLMEIFRI